MIAISLPLAVVVPLFTAAALMLLRTPGWPRRVLTLAPLAAVAGYAAVLIAATRDGDVYAQGVGLWPGGIAIPFAADTVSALMLCATAALTLVCTAFGMAAGEDERPYFAPLVLVLYAGVAGALLTADLFNLFVFVEVMLLPAYVLMSMFGGERRFAAARLYITFNLIASATFLVGIAFLYGLAGRVNIAALAGAGSDTGVAVAVGVIVVALAMKAGVVPLHGWLPRTYPMTSPTVTAIFSGLHTKVAVYAIYRIYAVVYDGDERFLALGLGIMCVTMLLGAACAMGEDTMRGNLAFNMVSGIGYILLGLALFGPLGIAAGLFYMVHHMVVVGSLFLTAGSVERTYGTQRLRDLGGLARTEPLIAFAFIGGALALAGIPPFSGFAGKYLILQASLDHGSGWVALAVVLASLFTLVSMMRVFNGVFWGPPTPRQLRAGALRPAGSDADADGNGRAPSDGGRGPDATGDGAATPDGSTITAQRRPRTHDKAARPLGRVPLALAAPAVLLVLVSLGLGVGAQGLLELTQQAAAGLVDPSEYVEAVLQP